MDALTDLLRPEAQELIVTMVQAELEGVRHNLRLNEHNKVGHTDIVRNGHYLSRPFQTGIAL